MAFQSAIGPDDEQTTDDTSAAASPAESRDDSPFSMGYDVEEYQLDAETTDQLLGLLVAVTNLL